MSNHLSQPPSAVVPRDVVFAALNEARQPDTHRRFSDESGTVGKRKKNKKKARRRNQSQAPDAKGRSKADRDPSPPPRGHDAVFVIAAARGLIQLGIWITGIFVLL